MADYVYKNADGDVFPVSGTPPVHAVGIVPGGTYTVHQLGPSSGSAVVPPADEFNIVCWGDSLTAGVGALYDSYVAQAALLLPDYTLFGRGIGGQTSAQIAARQGSLPIRVTNPTIPAWDIAETKLSTRFSSGVPSGFSGTEYAGSPKGKMKWQPAGAGTIKQTVYAFGAAIPSGSTVLIRGKVSDITAGASPAAGFSCGVRSAGGSFTGGNVVLNSVGEFSALKTTAADGVDFAFARGPDQQADIFLELDYIEVLVLSGAQPAGAAISAKNINILISGGAFSGSAIGNLGGVPGTMSTDGSGNWTFTRTGLGPALAAGTNTPFVIAEAAGLLHKTAWLWPGRNDVGSGTFESDLQAALGVMIASLPHDRFLVGAVLPRSDEPIGSAAYTKIMAKNADLSARYGGRFVNVYQALMNATDPFRDAGDIAAGTIPARFRSDEIHGTPISYGIVADAFVERHKSMVARKWAA